MDGWEGDGYLEAWAAWVRGGLILRSHGLLECVTSVTHRFGENRTEELSFGSFTFRLFGLGSLV